MFYNKNQLFSYLVNKYTQHDIIQHIKFIESGSYCFHVIYNEV